MSIEAIGMQVNSWWTVPLQDQKNPDTNALVAWSQNTVVLSFRGTANMANALSDLKVRFCM